MSSPVDEVMWSRFYAAVAGGGAVGDGDVCPEPFADYHAKIADAMLLEFRKRFPIPKKWG